MMDNYLELGTLELPSVGAVFGHVTHLAILVGLMLNAVLHRVFVMKGPRWSHFVMPLSAVLALAWLYPQFDSHLVFGFIVILMVAGFVGPAAEDVGEVVVHRDCSVGQWAR